MHVNYAAWAGLADSEHPAPQLIAILPENVSGGSAEGITGSFEPKLAYYAGIREASTTGSMRYIGDPADPYSGGDEIRPIPLMFAVNYGTDGQFDPILTYCDQVINEHVEVTLGHLSNTKIKEDQKESWKNEIKALGVEWGLDPSTVIKAKNYKHILEPIIASVFILDSGISKSD